MIFALASGGFTFKELSVGECLDRADDREEVFAVRQLGSVSSTSHATVYNKLEVKVSLWDHEGKGWWDLVLGDLVHALLFPKAVPFHELHNDVEVPTDSVNPAFNVEAGGLSKMRRNKGRSVLEGSLRSGVHTMGAALEPRFVSRETER